MALFRYLCHVKNAHKNNPLYGICICLLTIRVIFVSLNKGSWKIKIRDRLKHMRRPAKREISNKENMPVENPSKRRKTGSSRLDETTEPLEPDDEQRFRDDVKKMEQQTAKKKTKIAHLKPLMDSTFSGRRHWIKTEMPPVYTIIEKFPALKIPRLVSIEHIHLSYASISACYFSFLGKTVLNPAL